MARKRKGHPINGWLVINKPLGVTSTACVGWVKRVLRPQKIGHAGTLDPLADGVLPLALGEATKTIPWVTDARKTYIFSVTWGVSRTTLDAEGEVTGRSEARPNQAHIEANLANMIGEVAQVPPKYSAIKLDGNRAYDLARDGHEFELKPRDVVLHSARILGHQPDITQIEIETGKGYYVRALARDLTIALGCHGHVSALRRAGVGNLLLSDAIKPDVLEALPEDSRLSSLLPVQHVLTHVPQVEISPQFAGDISMGRAVIAPRFTGQDLSSCLAVVGPKPLAIGRVTNGIFHPKKVFNLG